MLFTQMPVWAVALCLGVSCAVKYVTTLRLWYSPLFREQSSGHNWMGPALITSALGGVLTIAVFYLFAGPWWSLVLGFIDAFAHWGSGYILHKKQLPHDHPEYQRFALYIRTFHGVLYVAFIVFVLFFEPRPI